MQAASIDDEGTVWQNDGIPVQLLKAPYQQVAGMLQTMATRNRTAAAANSRKECEGLYEIDNAATLGTGKQLTDKELTNINMARAGSAWDQNTAFWAGQAEEQECVLCGQKEIGNHVWTCKELEKEREEVDEGIAKLDPGKLPAAVKQGVAPAMNANPRYPYWGKQETPEEDHKLRFLCGCSNESFMGTVVSSKTKDIPDHCTARAMMQRRINEHGSNDLPMPKRVTEGEVPEKPNAYPDGSVKNPKDAN